MSINLIKFLIILALVIVIFIPALFLFILKKPSFKKPNNKKNILFFLLSILELTVICIVINFLHSIGDTISKIPFINKLVEVVKNSTSDRTDYIAFVILTLLVNLVILYAYLILKLFVFGTIKKIVIKKVNDEKEEESTDTELSEEENENKTRKLVEFLSKEKNEADKKVIVDEFGDEETVGSIFTDLKEKICGFFFEGPGYVYVKPWVLKCVNVLQIFIYIVFTLYFLIFVVLTLTSLFKLPDFMYDFIMNFLHIDKWYIYPFISLIILQEICNTFKSTLLKTESSYEKEEKRKKKELQRNLKELQLLLKQRFDKEHHLRFYPSIEPKEIQSYVPTNLAYTPALEFIRNQMNVTSGHIVQSYLECLDAMYNENHVYFCASFYSEFGEYLIAYTYTRLLAGERVIFVVPNQKEREEFKKYIRTRLTSLTKCSEEYSWRVYTSDERLDQADVLIVSPDEFKTDIIVTNSPIFFEEVCNAIFIDVDKIVMLESYLCPIISMRLQRATNNRVKFIFLTSSIYRGFSAGSLPKFFCIDKVLNFSGAKENESVTYNVWNRESKSNRIYNKNGQTLTTPECIIAELALSYNIDGVRIITSAAIEHSDKEYLTKHNVEINNLYKEIPEVNYLIYTDERCNLSAAVYLCARFRGKTESIIHILTKPYLLREYFLSKMNNEDFVNRSSFIQPRVVEHADNQKLSLLKVYCEATSEEGIEINDFTNRMRHVITLSLKRGDNSLCEYCKQILEKYDNNISKISLKDLTSYLIAGLCDNVKTPIYESNGEKAKDYYIIVDNTLSDGFNLVKSKSIVFKRTKDVFEKILIGNEKVSLVLNDKSIGYLDTFPTRVKSEFIIGQNIVFNNVEYEIEQISDDCKTIFLKRENVKYKNTLDTILLRRYKNIELVEQIGLSGELYNSQTNLEYIKVRKFKANFKGETYGFYNLMSDNQSLNFVNGVQGNPLLNSEIVSNMARNVKLGKVLELELIARIPATDSMRMLLAAVINEFIKTLFPSAYRCISICPILEKPFDYADDSIPDSYEEYVSRLYPYIINDNNNDYLIEINSNRLRFLFINDTENEDVGVLDWLFDLQGHLMQELLVNVYSYLAWLKLRPEQNHYIYFGNNHLANCYDLDGCCELLKGLNLLLSDAGADDFETASNENDEVIERCSFCHSIVESGRFTTFNKTRFICAECFNVVSSQEKLVEAYSDVFEYLTSEYKNEKFRHLDIELDEHYALEKGKELNEYYYKFDHNTHSVKVEKDIPINNAKAALLRATISSWQADNDLLISYIDGQLYYEELKYLRLIAKENNAQWIYDNISEEIRLVVDEIDNYIKNSNSSDVEDASNITLTSFDYIREKAKELDNDEFEKNNEELIDFDDDHIGFYNPNNIPRLWKRYLRMTKQEIEDEAQQDEVIDEISEDSEEIEKFEKDGENMAIPVYRDQCLSPLNNDEFIDEEESSDFEDEDIEEKSSDFDNDANKEDLNSNDEVPDEPTLSKKELRKLKKEEKKKQKEEKKTKKNQERNLLDEENKKKAQEKKAEKEEEKKKKREERISKKEEKKKQKENDSKNDEQDIKEKKSKKKVSFGEKMIPYEEDEKTNFKIKLYNEIARAAYNLSDEMITYSPLTLNEVNSIFTCVCGDYPELFWVSGYSYTNS